MNAHRLKISCFLSLFVLSAHADILDRIEYKVGRVLTEASAINAEVNNLETRVTNLETIEYGGNLVPFTNNDGNLYPVELAVSPVVLRRVTGLSRMPRTQAALEIPNIEDFGGIWWRNVVAESWIAVNPRDQGNILVGVARDRSNLQFALGSLVYTTINGGDTWDVVHTTLSRCQGPTNAGSDADFQEAVKPSVVFDSQGINAFMICVSSNARLDNPSDTSPNNDEAIVVIRSQNGGISWNEPGIVIGDDGADHWMRTPTINTNPFVDDSVYAMWSDLQFFVGNGNNSLIRLSRSLDGGTIWDVPIDVVTVDSSIANFAPIEAQVFVSPFGSSELFMLVKNSQLFTPYADAKFTGIVAHSHDGGATWTTFYNILPSVPVNVAQDPDEPGTYIRTAPTSFDAAINPSDNRLYVAVQSDIFCGPGLGGVVIATSTDGGLTFVNAQPVNPSTLSAQAFNPSIAVNDANQVGILFYDFRNHTPGSPALETDVWLAVYNEDLSVKLEEIRITPVSFDMRQAMRASLDIIGIDGGAKHYYLGDYCKLQANVFDFIACFPVTNPPYGVGPSPIPTSTFQYDGRHRQDILFAQVTP